MPINFVLRWSSQIHLYPDKKRDKTKTKWQVHGFDKDNSLLAIVHSALLEAGVDTKIPLASCNKLLKMVLPRQPR